MQFDADGNPLTTNFADYPMLSAAELPCFDLHGIETPTPVNPLGAKGIGESGTIGAIAAVHNACATPSAPTSTRRSRRSGSGVSWKPQRVDDAVMMYLDRIGAASRPERHTWEPDECALYAIAVGAGMVDEAFTLDTFHGKDQLVYPTFVLSGVLAAESATWPDPAS